MHRLWNLPRQMPRGGLGFAEREDKNIGGEVHTLSGLPGKLPCGAFLGEKFLSNLLSNLDPGACLSLLRLRPDVRRENDVVQLKQLALL